MTASKGKWSPQEHAGHLLDLESLWQKRVEDFAWAAERLTAADLSNRKTTEANHNASNCRAILAGFRTARQNLLNRAERFEPAAFKRPLPHPRLQTPMTLTDHLCFVAEHDDHHLAIIWQLAQSTGG